MSVMVKNCWSAAASMSKRETPPVAVAMVARIDCDGCVTPGPMPMVWIRTPYVATGLGEQRRDAGVVAALLRGDHELRELLNHGIDVLQAVGEQDDVPVRPHRLERARRPLEPEDRGLHAAAHRGEPAGAGGIGVQVDDERAHVRQHRDQRVARPARCTGSRRCGST